MFLDTTPDADALRGTGFGDGTPILAGRVVALGSVFGFGSGIEPLDRYGADDFPGLQSLVAAGVDTLSIAIDSVDAAVFPEGVPGTLAGIAPSGFPFTFIDPSQRYETPTGVQVPDIGQVNGLDEPDLVLQTRLALSLVPEPSSPLLVALGLAALVAGRAMPVGRRKRSLPTIPRAA